MKLKLEPSITGQRTDKPVLDIDWDQGAETVTGLGADIILEIARWGSIHTHPIPSTWQFSDKPLSNKTDMAAIIGWYWKLPAELADYYPQLDEEESSDVQVIY